MSSTSHGLRTPANSTLHLEEFIARVQCLKKDNQLDLEHFWDLVRRLHVSEDWIAEHVNFRDDTYTRNLVTLTPRFEMLVLCWKPGQNSKIHDHMNSFSVVKIVRGTLTNHLYERTDDRSKPGECELRKIRSDLVGPGDYAPLDFGGIHMMENQPDSGENMVSLHFYAEPLREIHIFHPEQKKVALQRMRYSLEDRI